LRATLKQLLSFFSDDFAAWLLEATVQEVFPLNVELPAIAKTVDQVFQVALADGRQLLLHIEFQGQRTPQPMKWRMLEYMGRLAQAHHLDLCSVVFYVGRGAGAQDEGEYHVNCADGQPALWWRYRVILLWQMKAEELLALGRPALLGLIGQTRMAAPSELLPQVVERIKTATPDPERQSRLLTALVALIDDEEIITMLEELIDEEELLLDTPFLQRIRNQGREKGREEGREEGHTKGLTKGREEGHTKGLAKGREEGEKIGFVTALWRTILEALVLRFDPPASLYKQVEAELTKLTNETDLQRLFAVVIRGETIAEFQAALRGIEAKNSQ
jgi:predicted transposase YdaD